MSLTALLFFVPVGDSNLQKGQEGGPRELQAGQPHLHPGKGDGAAYPGGHNQARGRKEGYQE